MPLAKKSLIYVYCITRDKPIQKSLSVDVEIYPIYMQGVYAVASKVSPDEFNENNLRKRLACMGWVEKKVRLHEGVIEEIMRDMTVLPFKFGTVFKKKENVEKMLNEQNTEFKRIIAYLEGKEEWGLKVYCNTEKLKEIIEKEDLSIKGIMQQINSSARGKAYILDKKKEDLVKDAINKTISLYTQDSFEKLKEISSEFKINKLLPKKVTEKKLNMVLNAAFLVDKNKLDRFKNMLGLLKDKYAKNMLVYECTGPWPPYNFSQISP